MADDVHHVVVAVGVAVGVAAAAAVHDSLSLILPRLLSSCEALCATAGSALEPDPAVDTLCFGDGDSATANLMSLVCRLLPPSSPAFLSRFSLLPLTAYAHLSPNMCILLLHIVNH